MFWIAERECNKDEMKNTATCIFIEFRMCNFHWGKYFLNKIVGSDSEATGPENDRPDVIIESEELMVEIDDFVLLLSILTTLLRLRGFRYFAHIDEHRPGGRLEPW